MLCLYVKVDGTVFIQICLRSRFQTVFGSLAAFFSVYTGKQLIKDYISLNKFKHITNVWSSETCHCRLCERLILELRFISHHYTFFNYAFFYKEVLFAQYFNFPNFFSIPVS